MHVCMDVWMYAHMRDCAYARSMSAWLRSLGGRAVRRLRVHTVGQFMPTHTRVHTCAHRCIPAYARTSTEARHTYADTCIPRILTQAKQRRCACQHTCRHAYIHIYLHTCMLHTRWYNKTFAMAACVHKRTYAYMRICICVYVQYVRVLLHTRISRHNVYAYTHNPA